MSHAPATFAFNQPYPFSAVSDQPDAACVDCSDEFKYPSSELTAIKVHRPRRPEGHWLIFCAEHLAEYQATDHPEDQESAVTTPKARSKTARAPKTSAGTAATGTSASTKKAAAPAEPRLATKVEREAAMCPDCFVEASLTGACPMCGEPIAT